MVAVKLLRSNRLAALTLQEVERARFEREMMLIGKLDHPNVVRLVDSGHLEVKAMTFWHHAGSVQFGN